MSLTLNNLKPAVGARKTAKRVGRGNASGHGTYSGRGLKGQRSRTGGRGGLKKRALKDQYLSKIPKLRGFKSLRPDYAIVKLAVLDRYFETGSLITKAALVQRGLVDRNARGIKILGPGQVTKAWAVKVEAVSESVRSAIEQAGGTIELQVKSRRRNVLPKEERIKLREKS